MRILSIAFCLSLLLACQSKETKQTTKPASLSQVEDEVVLTEAQLANTPVEAALMGSSPISRTIRLNGKVDVPPGKSVTLTAPVSGYISKLSLIEGMKVSKGQVLLSLQDQQIIQLQQDYLAAKSKYHFARLEYERQRELNASQASSDKVMQQAQAEMNYQQILMSTLSEKLKLLNLQPGSVSTNHIAQSIPLYSALSGYVTRVLASNGKYVAPGEVLVELMDPSEIHLRLRVFESDLRSLQIGQQIMAYSNTEPNRPVACTVSLIGQELGPDGTAEIHCHFTQPNSSLLPGMYMYADVELSSVQANVLPESAIVMFEGKHFVFLETGARRYRMLEVQTGQQSSGVVELLNPSELEGKKVVMSGAYTLLMALKNTGE